MTCAGKMSHNEQKLLEFEDQGKLYLICLPGNMQVSSVASEVFVSDAVCVCVCVSDSVCVCVSDAVCVCVCF